MSTAIFIFRRDLRVSDNLGLIHALNNPDVKTIIPTFIFTPEQIDASQNKYFSNHAVQFMCESIDDLATSQLNKQLLVCKGDNLTVLESIYKVTPFKYVYFNRDHSHYAIKRDAQIENWCLKRGITCLYRDFEDYTLMPLDTCKTYTVFAPFYNHYLKFLSISQIKSVPAKILQEKLTKIKIPQAIALGDIHQFYRRTEDLVVNGGRRLALERLKSVGPLKASYQDQRNMPANARGTTRLSAYIKFGCVSIREVYWECVKSFKTRDHALIRELFFREFYYKIYAEKPELQRTTAFLDKIEARLPPYRRAVPQEKLWVAWCRGQTGFPIVDAGMRQLLMTGFTHNRVRMIQGSVATRYFNFDWRDCARFYAQHLVDIDPIVNIASWQWCAGVGVDAMYYRAPFNPFLQSKKYDPEAEYIKRYVPELASVKSEHIHKWHMPKIRALYPDVTYNAPVL
jgi:deoxyribodipyrimidine photo-lyase